jgi:hypothetical protein
MPQDYIQIFKGSPIEVMAVVDSLDALGIVPVVKDPSLSARLAGFGILNTQQSLLVHKDEEQQAIEALNTLDLY